MKKMRPIRIATQGKAWKDLMKVQSRVRIPSPLLSNLTNLMTRKRRKKLMEIMLPPGCQIQNIKVNKKTGLVMSAESRSPQLYFAIAPIILYFVIFHYWGSIASTLYLKAPDGGLNYVIVFSAI